MPTPDGYLTIEEAAEHMNCSKATIRRRIKSGQYQAELRPTPFGDQFFINPIELTGAIRAIQTLQISQPITKDELQTMIEKQSLFLAEIIKEQQKKIETLEKEIKDLKAYTEGYTNSIGQREKRFMDKLEAIRTAQEAQAEQAKKPWYKKLFKNKGSGSHE